MERKIEMVSMGTAAGALPAALAGAIGGGSRGEMPIARPAKRRTHYEARGYMRPTKGFCGGARYKGSPAAKRATRRGGNPAAHA